MCAESHRLVKWGPPPRSRPPARTSPLGGSVTDATTTEEQGPAPGQPWLHDLEICVHGNVTCLSDRGGDVDGGATGLYVDDRRVLSRLRLRCDGHRPTTLASVSTGGVTRVQQSVRHLGSPGADPTVEIHRERTLVDGGMRELVTLRSRAAEPVVATLRLEVAGDGADLSSVKGGRPPSAPLALHTVDGARPALSWSDTRHRTLVRTDAGSADLTQGPGGQQHGVLEWTARVDPGAEAAWRLDVEVRRVAATPFDAEPAGVQLGWDGVAVAAQDRRLDLTVASSFADLAGLALSDPDSPSDVFAGAGTPWYLTLFGRDSLWAARLTLPFGTTLAAGTLRTLARRQGRAVDPTAAEEPGKILHEVRRSGFADPSSHLHLPPIYFGTVDATPLWVCLLHEAWRWGLDGAVLDELRPNLDAALGWLRGAVDSSPDALIRYLDESGAGLSNQGWKDSGDAMRDRHGRVVEPPIALVETQAYAVQAALAAAELREQHWSEPGDELRSWAAALAARVRERFWVTDAEGPYLAMALDRDGRPVDGIGSNMGHALGTGLLDDEESRLVAQRLSGPDLLGSFGVRTLSLSNPAFNPIGYHTGSVWTHDTAICALGLAADGHGPEAARVLRAMVDAATWFDFRFPELYGGDLGLDRPVPYPASCRPQAWAAASAAAIVSGVLGLSADAPRRVLRLRPMRPAPFGALTVTGLRVAGEAVEVGVDAAGEVTHVSAPDWLTVQVGGR